MKRSIESLSTFLDLAEKLKFELRQSSSLAGNRDIVASHVWRVSLIILSFGHYIKKDYDREKALKMAIIHDLGEIIAGDVGVGSILTKEAASKRQKEELHAFLYFQELLSCSLGDDIINLWKEFEENTTFEAKLVNAADKLEALLQNIEGNIPDPILSISKNKEQLLESFRFDPFIYKFAETLLRRYHENQRRAHDCK